MKKIAFLSIIALGLWSCQTGQKSENMDMAMSSSSFPQNSNDQMKTFYDFSFTTLNGDKINFSTYRGKRILVVNTASECGYTPQYKQLEDLYEEFGGDKFVVIGFPSNDFGGQEPGSSKEIAAFCEKNYGVTFPLMEKSEVKGEEQNPVYAWLTHKSQNGVSDAEVKWNFNKFLIDEQGHWVAYYPSGVEPLDERIVKFAKGE